MISDHSRRSVLKGIGVGSVALVGGTGVVSAGGPPSEGETILDLAVADPVLEVIEAAVIEAGLDGALDGNRQFTVFAPTNAAFGELGVTADNVGTIDFESAVGSSLTEILTYHVAPGDRDSTSVLDAESIPTLNGAKLDVDSENVQINGENIVVPNVNASNGYVHVIDGVLLT